MKKGAKKQRLLWASTSVKNPAYPDTLYVAPLIGPDTVSHLNSVCVCVWLEYAEKGTQELTSKKGSFITICKKFLVLNRFPPCQTKLSKHLLITGPSEGR